MPRLQDGSVRLWGEGTQPAPPGHTEFVTAAAISADSAVAVTGDNVSDPGRMSAYSPAGHCMHGTTLPANVQLFGRSSLNAHRLPPARGVEWEPQAVGRGGGRGRAAHACREGCHANGVCVLACGWRPEVAPRVVQGERCVAPVAL